MNRYAKLDANGVVVDIILAISQPADAEGFTFVLDEGQFAEPLPPQPAAPVPHAMIADGVVVNLVNAPAGTTEHDGKLLVELNGSPAGIGWTYAGGVFSPPPVDLEALKAERKAAVMAKRDERIDGGLTFGGHEFQTRAQDRENVAGASQLAALWLMQAGDANTLRWADPDRDFVWIDAVNELRPMSATTVIAFGRALAGMKSACIFHALGLKQAIDAASTEAEIRAIDIAAGWP